jgi:hypothetical protein
VSIFFYKEVKQNLEYVYSYLESTPIFNNDICDLIEGLKNKLDLGSDSSMKQVH